ncbi:MAG: Mu transposase C-terminal domain-containing protein [Rhizobiaceae bacterium]
MRAQEYFTPLEVAELAKRLDVNSVPSDKANLQKFIVKNNFGSSPLTRNRSGRGGGVEYHFSLFPEEFVVAYIDNRRREQAENDARVAMAEEQNALEALSGTALSAKQTKVMEARAGIIQAVKAYALAEGCGNGNAVMAVLALIETDRRLFAIAKTANDRAGNGRKLSRRTIYNWMKAQADGGVASLAPKATRDTASFPQWFPIFMGFYARPQSPTITVALDQYIDKARPNDPPSYDAVRRCLKKLDKVQGTQARYRGREGALALKARHAYVLRDTSGLLPTSVYTSDGKLFDAEVQHPVHGRPFRPEITPILDIATRKCVGWSVGLAENSRDVIAALRDATVSHGVAAIFYVDRGPGFRNDALDNALTGFCARLGTTKMHSLPYNSQARGIMERFHATVFTPLSKTFSSYIGEDMDREAGHKAHKNSRKDLKEFGTSALLPTWVEFIQSVEKSINDYNEAPHSGLRVRNAQGRKVEQTPNQSWDAAVINGFEAVTVNPIEADQLFRPVVRRRTNRAMVSWIGNSYFDLGLEPFHGTDILVGYDVRDATKMWCYEIDIVDGEELPGKLICVAAFEGNKERYVPYSMEQKAIEDRLKGRERRLQVHMDEVQAEAAPNRFLTGEANIPFSIVEKQVTTIDAVTNDTSPLSKVAAPQSPSAPALKIVRAKGERPRFSEDYELATWCLNNPEKVTEKDRSLLLTLTRSKSDLEYLRINGVDLESLRGLLRADATTPKKQRQE